MKSRYVICSITSIGLAMPPVQKAFQTASTWLFSAPVTMLVGPPCHALWPRERLGFESVRRLGRSTFGCRTFVLTLAASVARTARPPQNGLMLLPAIILITLALVFYTIGVWSERAQKTLKPWHTVFFGLGLAADASGTYLMSLIADANRAAGVEPSILNQVMAISGLVALILMAVHFAWAVVVLVRQRENELHRFHRFSVVVWAIWLVPYVTGALGSSLG